MLTQDEVDFFADMMGFKELGAGDTVNEPTKVFRIELPNGHGPYNSGLPNAHDIYEVICAEKPGYDCAKFARMNREKCGITDFKFGKAHGSAFYACDSLDDLTKWFPNKARVYLSSLKAVIAVYQIKKGGHILNVGNGEVIFAKQEAEKVETLDIVSTQEIKN